jgi:hypothetical protein
MKINTNDRTFSNVAAILNLCDITTERQHANGTRAFLDDSLPDAAVYTVHSNGYVRRTTADGRQYQLNQTRSSKQDSIVRKTRVLSSSTNESVGILLRGVVNYRRTNGIDC